MPGSMTESKPTAPARIAPAGLMFLAITSVGWGFNWPVTKYLLSELPPLTLKGGVVVRTLDDAVAFVRSYRDPHLPKSSAAVLLSIEEANDKNRGRVAASMFRVWAKAEGVLVSMD